MGGKRLRVRHRSALAVAFVALVLALVIERSALAQPRPGGSGARAAPAAAPGPSRPPVRPPPTWTATLGSATFQVIVDSEGGGIRTIALRWRDAFVPLLSTSDLDHQMWLGFAVDTRVVPFVRCQVDGGAVASFDLTAPSGTIDLGKTEGRFTLCSWQPPAEGGSEPRIGALVATFVASESPARLSVRASFDAARWRDATGATAPNKPAKPPALTFATLSGNIPVGRPFRDDCVRGPEAEVCCSSLGFIALTLPRGGNVPVDGTDAAVIHVGLRDEAQPGVVPGADLARPAPADAIAGGFLGMLVPPFGSEVSIVLAGLLAGVLARLLTAPPRISSLRGRKPSPWQRSRLVRMLGRAAFLVGLVLSARAFRSTPSLALASSMYRMDFTGDAPYPIAVAALSSVLVAGWAILDRDSLSAPGWRKAVAWRVLLGVGLAALLALNGSGILAPAAALLGFAAVDAALRRFAVGHVFLAADELVAAPVAPSRPPRPPGPVARAFDRVSTAVGQAIMVVGFALFALACVGAWAVGCYQTINPSGGDEPVTVETRRRGRVVSTRVLTRRQWNREQGIGFSIGGVVLFLVGAGAMSRRR
jgi:hypothetical protein